MNYEKVYYQIIEKRIIKPPVGYTEKHHIIPRSLNGTNEDDNIVKLTAREHFICHYLLTKMYRKMSYEWFKMAFAFNMMCNIQTYNSYSNSKLYELARINFAIAISKINKIKQKGNKNSQYGKMWISNLEEKISKPVQKDSILKYPWVKGRNKWIEIEKNRISKEHKEQRILNMQEKSIYFWNLFKKGNYTSIRDFHKKSSYKYSQPNLIKQWKKYIPEYSLLTHEGISLHSINLPG
jgi:hypothetical protein